MEMDDRMEEDKVRFMDEFGDDYGYNNNIDHIRSTHFNRLNHQGIFYLDHAGATLYSELQLQAIFQDLSSTVYANPHSQSNSSLATSDIVADARRQVLSICNASPSEYKCIFTSGATAALKLVGEAFPWSSQSSFMYTIENHNSVLGIREYALNKGAAAITIDFEEAAYRNGLRSSETVKVKQHHVQKRNDNRILEENSTGDTYSLFAFPSECNFSGVRFNLDLINIIKEDSQRILAGSPYCNGCWMVLVDAAKGCSTDPPDLSKFKPDFVVLSFYKLFGYPTGLGALIVRNEAAKLLKKTYFGGGTVAASIADIDYVKRREGVEEKFEDGTLSFLSIGSIRHGLKILNTLTMAAISRHTASLATYTRNMLLGLRHANGSKVCKIYGLDNPEASCDGLGPIVSFNLKRPNGSWIGYREVEKLASLSGIQLRTGCFCNPGACAKHLGLSHVDLLSNIEAGHICWGDHDVLHGKPTGAVRVSFGYMSTFEDAWRFISFIVSSFVSVPAENGSFCSLRSLSIMPSPQGPGRGTAEYYLKSITVYPIKSCAGFTVNSWPLSRTGLLHDREWLLKSSDGEILTQKKVPEMCYISTSIDLITGVLYVQSPRCKEELHIELKSDPSLSKSEEMDLHTQRYEVYGYGSTIDAWFSNAVGRSCSLLRRHGFGNYSISNVTKGIGMCRDLEARLNFVNEAQILLISEASVSDLNNRLSSKVVQKDFPGSPIQVNPMRFRPNIVVAGGEPYVEDSWRRLKIGDSYFTSLGGCNRCQMINLNSQGREVQRLNEPLATLAAYRRVKGKILFGILLRSEDSNKVGEEACTWLRVNHVVYPDPEEV